MRASQRKGKKMILASKSPRRKEILSQFGFEIEIITADIEEVSDKEGIREQLMDISRKKSSEIARENPQKYVVSADTAVIIDDEMLGKPKSREEAKRMLKKLSGREHEVITAYTLFNLTEGIEHSHYDTTRVIFKDLTDEEIEWYIDTDEPMDKAGAYGIQGKGAILIERIEGDFYNVMGFPLSRFYEDLKSLGLNMSKIKRM